MEGAPDMFRRVVVFPTPSSWVAPADGDSAHLQISRVVSPRATRIRKQRVARKMGKSLQFASCIFILYFAHSLILLIRELRWVCRFTL